MPTNSKIPIFKRRPPLHYTCEVGVTYTPEDNNTYIRRTTVDVVECVNIPLAESPDWFNCHMCGSDERYSQPVLSDDVFIRQIRINQNGVNNYKLYLFDGNDEIIEDTGGVSFTTFTDGFKNKYMNITITPANIPSECFYFRLYAFAEAFNEGVLDACIAVKLSLGRGQKESEVLCMLEQQADPTIYYSEIFRKTNDTCENTLLFEASYPSYDCNSNFYGSAQTGSNGYNSLKVRIPATIEKAEMAFEETIVFNTKRNSKQTDTYILRTEKLPPYVVEQLAVIFQAKSFTIDGVSYKMLSKRLNKNFDEGSMWIINTTLMRDCDLDFLCS